MLFRSTGNQTVVINGWNFGPLGSGVSLGYAPPSGGYGGVNGLLYTATGCVVVNHSVILCNTSEGVGANLQWSVVIGNQSSGVSGASLTTSYRSPMITLVTILYTDGSNSTNSSALSSLPTAGGSLIAMTGWNMGQIGRAHV